MSESKFSSEHLRSVLSFFGNENNNKAIWFVDNTESKTLYLSESYETIWGYPREIVYKNSTEWGNYILGDDKNDFLNQFFYAPPQKGVCYYRVNSAEGKIVYLKDKFFALYDSNNHCIARAGIAEELSALTWQSEKETLSRPVNAKQKNKDCIIIDPVDNSDFEQDYKKIIKRELKINDLCTSDKNLGRGNSNNKFKLILTNGNKVYLTKRESDCFYHLIQGNSSKQIARNLGISDRTVEVHISHVKDKAGYKRCSELISNTAELISV